jgi:ubiquitin C-terminal hydrolase
VRQVCFVLLIILRCNKLTDAKKHLKLVSTKLPSILTIVFKRFGFGSRGEKNTKPVSFEEVLDLAPYSLGGEKGPSLYHLYAILIHSGHSCHSGHYYCYVKNSNGAWYQMDDDEVVQSSIKQALMQKKGAYVLFYSKEPSPIKKVSQFI